MENQVYLIRDAANHVIGWASGIGDAEAIVEKLNGTRYEPCNKLKA